MNRMSVEQERMIPVFTVLKNGAVLKNIFVINKPPDDSINEEILLVGRHPDCNIVLMHPSISRFHLQINSNPFSRKLVVTDLSSVHGTWVSEKKVEAGDRVQVHEGDTIRLGGSSRVYRLHWVPLSFAYDSEKPFVSPMDLDMVKEKDEEERGQGAEGDCELNNFQDLNPISAEIREGQSSDLVLEDISSMIPKDNWESILDKEVQSISFEPECRDGSFYAEHDVNSLSDINDEIRQLLGLKNVEEDILESRDEQFEDQDHSSCHDFAGEGTSRSESKDVLLAQSEDESNDAVWFDSLLSSEDGELNAASEAPEESVDKYKEVDNFSYEMESFEAPLIFADRPENKENEILKPHNAPQPTYDEANQEHCSGDVSFISPYKETCGEANQENCSGNQLPELGFIGPYKETCGEANQEKCSGEQLAEVSFISPYKEKCEANQENCSGDQLADVSFISSFKETCGYYKLVTESLNPSPPVGKFVSEVIENKESVTAGPAVSQIGNFEVRSEKNSHNILSRRGKRASGLKLQTSWSRGNTKDEFNNQGCTKDRLVTKVLFSSSEEETIAPDKENYSPNTLLLKSLKKQSKLEEVQLSNSYSSPSPKRIFSPYIELEESMTFSSDKENQTPKVLQPRKSESRTSTSRSILGQEMVLKEKKAERLPLQSLLSNSPVKSPSDFSAPTAATRSCLSVSYTQTVQKINSLEEAKRGWTMVVDTSSLLDKESRKSLQLLQGLKGTQLVIPRLVIRELDCMNRRGSLFRRTTEASVALEWIEECMLNTIWWIHVQISIEEGEQTAPTPPASPHSHFSESNGGLPFWTTVSASFSSPTSEDHIIDYALSNRRLNNNGQLVLVSNDISLKIKAMAEGLICETAQEFRSSLVNPFSERFLWADSSPRGQTWSVIDDAELKDKYYRSPSKKSSKGKSNKGLKLILLHNSRYGQNSWPVRTY